MTETTTPKKRVTTRKKSSTATAAPKKRAPRKISARTTTSESAQVKQTVHTPVKKNAERTYTFAVGRRKSAIARVRFIPKGSNQFTVNGRSVENYFPTFELQKIARDPQELTKFGSGGDISVKVQGGGIHGQAEAVRLGVSRVFVKLDAELRTSLKRAGFMTRDPRVKERKKYGLKRARRAPQWQKR